MAYGVRDPQLHNLPGQQPQRPVGVPFRRLPLVHGDDPGFRLAVEDLRHWRRLAPLPFQSPLKTFFDQVPANALDRLRPTRKRLRDLPVGPCRSVGVGFQKDLGAADPLATAPCGLFRGRSRVPRPSAGQCTSCTWECLSVAHTEALNSKYGIACQPFYYDNALDTLKEPTTFHLSRIHVTTGRPCKSEAKPR